jgi:hypothetical protein
MYSTKMVVQTSNIGHLSKIFRYKMLKSLSSYSAAKGHERVKLEKFMRSADVILNEVLFCEFYVDNFGRAVKEPKEKACIPDAGCIM